MDTEYFLQISKNRKKRLIAAKILRYSLDSKISGRN